MNQFIKIDEFFNSIIQLRFNGDPFHRAAINTKCRISCLWRDANTIERNWRHFTCAHWTHVGTEGTEGERSCKKEKCIGRYIFHKITLKLFLIHDVTHNLLLFELVTPRTRCRRFLVWMPIQRIASIFPFVKIFVIAHIQDKSFSRSSFDFHVLIFKRIFHFLYAGGSPSCVHCMTHHLGNLVKKKWLANHTAGDPFDAILVHNRILYLPNVSFGICFIAFISSLVDAFVASLLWSPIIQSNIQLKCSLYCNSKPGSVIYSSESSHKTILGPWWYPQSECHLVAPHW